ncbi:hypothetical protein JCM11641_000124 [Rhodosporidiobolus odoratus]
MPPPYEATTGADVGSSSALRVPRSPVICPPSPSPSMAIPYSPAPSFSSTMPTRRGVPAPINTPPPYVCTPPPQSPISPVSLEELDADPHYLATPTQRSYFVQLSDLFEMEAQGTKDEAAPQGRMAREMKEKRERRTSGKVPVLRKNVPVGQRTPSCFGCCTIS